MPLFKQTFFKPGRYHLGGGFYRDVSPSDVADYVRGTQELLQSGHAAPILYEHAAPGSAEGSPVQLSATETKSRRDELAKQVKHGAGWIKKIWLTPEGDAAWQLEVTDPDAAKSLKNGSIKFTSPELRESWTDGKGKTFKRIFSHAALTHKPRNLDQSSIEEVATGSPALAVQFSLADWQPLQFSTDEDEDKEMDEEVSDGGPEGEDKSPEMTDDKEENPDMPEQPKGEHPQLKAAIEHLKMAPHNISMPDDTTEETFIRDLLTALKTVQQVKQQQEADDAEEEAEDGEDHGDMDPENKDPEYGGQGASGKGGMIEEKPPIQFSAADLSEGRVPGKLLAAVMRNKLDSTELRIKGLYDAGKITPSLARKLKERAGVMQFSEEGEEGISLKLSEVIQLLDENLNKETFAHLTAEQYSTAVMDTPPEEMLSRPDGEMTKEQAKAYVDKQAEYIPGLKPKK